MDPAVANKKLCENVNGELSRRAIMHWKTKYRVYADCSRAIGGNGTPTVWGNNVTDVDCFLLDKQKGKISTFVVGGDNVYDPSVLCNLDMLQTVMDDPEGGNARMTDPDGTRITVAHVLKNFGKYFQHMGVAKDVNMLGNFKDCTLRFQVHIVELEVGQTLEEFEEAQLLMTSMNYHSRAGQARNVNILFTAQGASVTTDASPPGVPVDLYLHGQSEDGDELHNYAIGIEATKRMFSDTGKQTTEEKVEQVARGRSAEVKLGPIHEDMIETCSVMHLQVPCKQKPLRRGTFCLGDDPMSDDDDDAPHYRSVSCADLRDSKPKETCRAASTHRGMDMGVAGPLNQTDLEPEDSGSAGIPTCTFSIFMVKPKNVDFGTEDVMNAIGLAEKVRTCAGEAHVRSHKSMIDAGASTHGIQPSVAFEIAETVKAIHKKAKKTNIPIGVF